MKITKQEILDTALDIFAERGYDSTILKDISDRLNVTKSAGLRQLLSLFN